MIKEKKLKDQNKSYYEDEETGNQYKWIVAGVSWPIGEKGYLVIGSVDFKENIYILKAVEAKSINEMLQKVCDNQEILKFKYVFCDDRDRAIMDLFFDFRRRKNKEGKGNFNWGIQPAPYLNDPKCLIFYTEKIRERIGYEKKTLFVGEDNSFLSEMISSLKPEELKNAAIVDQPAIFALGAVVCELDSYKHKMDVEEKIKKMNRERQGNWFKRI